ncbi:MAG: 23S rRNA (uracil(1939)-C(5))-methyltransferase RlmD, partial [Clostridia bacterium]|nr:23S rRNA (uracil(1939)-C(5))-methyltransferase RlmD [Clostridia bacterium]
EETVLAAKAVADWANANSVQAYDEASCTGVLRHVVVRRCTGGTAVCVVTSGRLPNKEDLIDRIKRAVPNVVSIVHNINSKDTNVICGAEYKLIWGENTVKESICGLEFDVSAESFLQVNRVQTEKLYRLAVDGLDLTGEENVADVFCGIGTISLMLANRARSVIGIEFVEKAVEDAKRNAELNGIDNAEFFSGSAERLLPRLVADGRSFDCITLDPPRKGADPAVLEAILKSGANRIAYVSCDPATLARDLKILCAGGFEILSVQPVDMFPFTHHIETVVHLRRNKATHQMNLDPAPYEMIENGSKTIELRLFDEKRRKIKPGDAIVFTNTDTGEKLSATVLNLHCFRSFEELYQTLPLMKCGYSKEKVAQAKPSDMEQYYSEELQKRYGVVGIELCLHEKNDEKV